MKLGITQRVDSSTAERRDCLAQEWNRLLSSLGHIAIALPNRAGLARQWVSELGLEGIILSGGNDVPSAPGAKDLVPERDALEGELIELCVEQALPLLGVCRGMQMLLSHFEIKPRPVQKHIGTTHALISVSDLPGFNEGELVNSFHQYGFAVDQIVAPWKVLATATDKTVEAVKHEALPLWGILWHPERSPDILPNRTLLNAIFTRSQK